MTLNLELSPELEEHLQELAAERGTTPDAVALQVLEGGLPARKRQTKREAVLSGYGRFAGVGGTVDDFLRERREEAQTEIDQAAARDAMARDREQRSAA